MSGVVRTLWRSGVWILLAVAGVLLVCAPQSAPLVVGLALLSTAWPVALAWRGARGTALRPAIVWAAVAVGLGTIAQVLAAAEPLASGRPMAGHWCYAAVLASFAASITVLNARTPGSGAWALLMALLVFVFLIPWVEGSGMARHAQGVERLQLNTPWTIFYGLLFVAGVTNYLPTRYGPAAAWFALGLGIEYLALTRPEWPLARKARAWSAVPWSLAIALWTAEARARRRPAALSSLDRAWLWFRDHWGVVWALRVLDRFNQSAEAQGWPVRLGWFGAMAAPGQPADAALSVPANAEATFRSLLRRFADPQRVAEAEADGDASPCQATDAR